MTHEPALSNYKSEFDAEPKSQVVKAPEDKGSSGLSAAAPVYCGLSTTIIDKARYTAEMAEMACDTIDIELKFKSDAVYYTQGRAYNQATESANRDPRQCDSSGANGQIGGDDLAKTPMTFPAERFDLTPSNSASDLAMFDFDTLDRGGRRR